MKNNIYLGYLKKGKLRQMSLQINLKDDLVGYRLHWQCQHSYL